MKTYSNGTTTYYRYRKDDDNRLKLLKPSWLRGKNVLDIGCNTGNVTLEVARQFKPFLLEGIDIDTQLINDAHKKHRALIRDMGQGSRGVSQPSKSSSGFSFIPRVVAQKKPTSVQINQNPYPLNVMFKAVDILTTSPSLSKTLYDTILCLSVTKWVQLNTGDEGLRTLFQRAYSLLSPGGVFFLEYQPWQSYIKNRNTSSITKSNFPALKIRPDEFESLLLAEGFEVSERLGTPLAQAKGFNRPVLVLTKPVSTASLKIGHLDASEVVTRCVEKRNKIHGNGIDTDTEDKPQVKKKEKKRKLLDILADDVNCSEAQKRKKRKAKKKLL